MKLSFEIEIESCPEEVFYFKFYPKTVRYHA